MLYVDVDTQRDFIEHDRNLPVPGAEDIRGNLRALTEFVEGRTVLKTADWHTHETEEIVFDGSEDMQETFPPHCMAGRPGAEFIEETSFEDYVVVDWRGDYSFRDMSDVASVDGGWPILLLKDKFNVFEGNDYTERVMEVLDPDDAVVYGVAGDVCVAQAVTGLVERGVEVTVVEDAIASLGEPPLDAWASMGVELTTTKEVINEAV